MGIKTKIRESAIEEGHRATDRFFNFMAIANGGGSVAVLTLMGSAQDSIHVGWAAIPLTFFAIGFVSLGISLFLDISATSHIAKQAMIFEQMDEAENQINTELVQSLKKLLDAMPDAPNFGLLKNWTGLSLCGLVLGSATGIVLLIAALGS